MSGPLVDVRNVSHRFGSFAALSDIVLTVDAGSYTVLLGPSGSGKTTLLSILGGFLVPNEGKVLIRGEDCTALPAARRPTTTVFQDYALFPHMTVGANVGFGLRMRGVASAERVEDAQKAWLRNARCEMKIPKGRACAFPQRLQDLQSSFQALDGFFLWHPSGPMGAS